MITKIKSTFSMASLVLVALLPSLIWAQATPVVNPYPSHDVEISVTSGKIVHDGNEPAMVWSEEISMPQAEWIRLKFSQIILGNKSDESNSSWIRITSLEDKAYQLLNAKSAAQWQNKSAYFNGDAVRIELFAIPNGRMNLVTLDAVVVGERIDEGLNATICDGVDDRQLSDDIRVGRAIPNGCTLWLFNDRNNCLLTAGHCAGGTDVASFNVPLSNSNGQPVFPPPEDQYAVDFDSMQATNGGTGNDWAYFGCFPNSNTGLTAFQAQGDSFELVDAPQTAGADDMIRITGHGSTSAPVSPTWNGAQKTHVGPFTSTSTTELRYRTDTTGGNSGSPVIFEPTGQAIGIHTHGGCGNGGGTNLGTSSLNAGFANALANPLGICDISIRFSFPSGLPESLTPEGGTTLIVTIDDSDVDADNSTMALNVEIAGSFQAIPMTDLGGDQFEVAFPATTCGESVRFFVSVDSVTGDTFTSPTNAPSNTYDVISASGFFAAFDDNFETNQNWTVSGNAATGQWQRGIPVGGGDRGDPPTDADGSGACYLTENSAGNTDVDDGSTILTSPTIDLTIGANEEAFLSYSRWFNNGGEEDDFEVEISNDNGATWLALETVAASDPINTIGGWIRVVFNVRDVIEPTAQMRVRFTASDTGNPSIVEAGVDGVDFSVVECVDFLLGDVNLDGVINLLDVAPFIELLNSGGYQGEADINQDGVVNLLDVALFIDLLGN